VTQKPASSFDVVVVGAGPAGASCAYWLASAGHRVCLVEKKSFPREKTCGDGLTPRAVKQLADMGLADALEPHHRYEGLRAWGFGHMLELPWPDHPDLPRFGYTVTRHDLDALVAGNAAKAGATLLQATEAVAVIREEMATPNPPGRGAPYPPDHTDPYPSGHTDPYPPGRTDPYPPGRKESGQNSRVCGVVVRDKGSSTTRELRAPVTVIADGANSRLGRELGASRRKDWPQGMAIRGYWESPRHAEPWIESHLDISDTDGTLLPGYGWIFPLGDGRVNLGVGLLDTHRRTRRGVESKAVNTTRLLEAFLRQVGRSWEIDVERPCAPPTGGRLPMGLAVGPRTGPGYLLAGDAAGTINPFNGEGISYAYETGRMAAQCASGVLNGGGTASLSRYDEMVEEAYGAYYRLGRSFVRLVGNPAVMRACVQGGMRSKAIMSVVMKVMANLFDDSHPGMAETALKGAYALTRLRDLVA
jgi:flavin-dependent dehydrogenase